MNWLVRILGSPVARQAGAMAAEKLAERWVQRERARREPPAEPPEPRPPDSSRASRPPSPLDLLEEEIAALEAGLKNAQSELRDVSTGLEELRSSMADLASACDQLQNDTARRFRTLARYAVACAVWNLLLTAVLLYLVFNR